MNLMHSFFFSPHCLSVCQLCVCFFSTLSCLSSPETLYGFLTSPMLQFTASHTDPAKPAEMILAQPTPPEQGRKPWILILKTLLLITTALLLLLF